MVILLSYFGIGYVGEFSKIIVIANNENPWPVSAYAQLNESGHFVLSERVTIAPNSRQVVASWFVTAGSHEVYVAWSDRAVSQSYYLMPFTTKNVVVDIDIGTW